MPSLVKDVIYEKQLIEHNGSRGFVYKIKPHTASTGNKYPKLWLCFDTEAHIEQVTEEVERQTLAFGYAVYNRHYKDRPLFTSKIQFFENKAQFADLLESVVKQGGKLHVIAHNVGYDWVISDINDELINRGWSMSFFSDAKAATIIPYRKNGKEIIFIDSYNWFRASLATIAKEFGLDKYDVDFHNVAEQELRIHCKRDVEILNHIMIKWFDLLRDENYGAFKPTIASQALEAFKQKFLDGEIETNQGVVQKDKERLCYYGGRTEANYIGNFDGSVYELDINSAYPSVMLDNLYPVGYRKSVNNPSIDFINDLPDNIGYFGEVDIDTTKAMYPKRIDERLVFPIGQFTTWLAGPELQQGIKRGDIKRIKRLHLYDLRPIFKNYIHEIYKRRLEARISGNSALALMYKYMLNSLYGKFGERKRVWTPVYETENPYNGSETVINLDTGQVERQITFNGIEYHLIASTHKSHSFPLISAYVTSYLRVKLNEAIEKVGPYAWLYCDTDSLYVTSVGLQRMQNDLHQTELGKWKFERHGDSIEIRGLKDYTFVGEQKIKGISKTATQESENTFKQRQFTTAHHAIVKGEMGVVYTFPVLKTLDRRYQKGIVTAQGWVRPHELEEFT